LPSGNQACQGYMHARLLDPLIPTRLKIHNALPIALHISLHAGLCPTYVDISIGMAMSEELTLIISVSSYCQMLLHQDTPFCSWIQIIPFWWSSAFRALDLASTACMSLLMQLHLRFN
jgi:hypothetical protein